MNCPSRTDEPETDGYNQNPPFLSADLTTREDLNGKANSRLTKGRDPEIVKDQDLSNLDVGSPSRDPEKSSGKVGVTSGHDVDPGHVGQSLRAPEETVSGGGRGLPKSRYLRSPFRSLNAVLRKFAKFVGPGFMVSVAYIDPGNYSTDVAAGATYRFRLLFIVLMSNIFAMFLQSLCVKLGTVTGMNLAQNCRAHLPKWLNWFLYVLAEVAIIATDIAEVIGTAIALNLLFPKLPLVAGCAISILDVLLILVFYRPNGGMKGLRAFEIFVAVLVIGVVVCFCIQLSLIQDTSVGEVFHGYLPSSAIVKSEGLYQSCGILGATVMPHSLYLGSGMVQPRLYEYDVKHNHLPPPVEDSDKPAYRPSLSAINFCLKYSIAELCISLFTFALFVNSAILIVAGASLSDIPDAASADLFSIHTLLSTSIAPAAGTIFALALLLSGVSAGIVCTIAGQMVSEGALNWTIAPWLRRLLTRSISITPSIIIAGAVGRDGLSAALNGTQVALSIVLPFVSAPLVYFTCRNRFMTVEDDSPRPRSGGEVEVDGTSVIIGDGGVGQRNGVKMRNHWITAMIAVCIWIIIAVMNVANLVLLKNQ